MNLFVTRLIFETDSTDLLEKILTSAKYTDISKAIDVVLKSYYDDLLSSQGSSSWHL